MKKIVFGVFILFPLVLAGRGLEDFRYYAREQSIEIDGVRMVYLDSGTGEAVLLIHGFSGNAFNWEDIFPALSQRYRVLVPDLPGYGKSECPAKKQKHLLLWYADFLARFLERLGIERAVVVGNSMGGAIAGWLALRHPEKVEKLVLVDSAGLFMPRIQFLTFLGALIPGKEMVKLIEEISPQTEKALSRLPKSEQKRALLADQRYKSELRECSSITMKRCVLSLGRDVFGDKLAEIKTPTLIIWGDDDSVISVKNAEKFAQKIPDARVVIIKGGDHTPMQHQPEEFLKALVDFINSVPSG